MTEILRIREADHKTLMKMSKSLGKPITEVLSEILKPLEITLFGELKPRNLVTRKTLDMVCFSVAPRRLVARPLLKGEKA